MAKSGVNATDTDIDFFIWPTFNDTDVSAFIACGVEVIKNEALVEVNKN